MRKNLGGGFDRHGLRLAAMTVLFLLLLAGLAGVAWAAAGSPPGEGGGGNLQVEGLIAVSGTVSDSTTGEFITGATVTIGTKSATTGEDGSYSIIDIQANDYTVSVSLTGYKTRTVNSVPVRGSTDDPMTLNISLTPNGAAIGTIQGYVVDINNRAIGIGGIIVQAADGLLAVTDSNGKFTIVDVPLYNTYAVSASPHATRGLLGRIVSRVPANGTIDLALAPVSGAQGLGSISGQLIEVNEDETTTPLAVAWVTAGFGLWASTGVDGNFQINNVVAGTYYLQFFKEGYEAATTSTTVSVGAETTVGSTSLTATPDAGFLEGWVQNSDGTRLNGVQVTVGDKTVLSGRKPGSDQTANNGYFRINGLSPAQYILQASLADHRTRTTNAAVVYPGGGGSPLEVTLVPEGVPVAVVSGTVRSAPGDAYIPGALVKLGWGLYTLTENDGSYSLSDVPVGIRKLEVSAAAYRARTINDVPIQPGASGTLVYNVALTVNNYTDLGTIRGYVVDIRSRGSGLGGVWVQAGNGLAAVTDSYGWFQINDVPRNYSYTVAALPRSGYGFLERSITGIRPGQTVDLALAPEVVGGLGAISGKVTRADGSDIPGATVAAGFGLWTVTDAGGNYQFSNLIPGTYYLQAFINGYEAVTGKVELVETTSSLARDFTLFAAADAGWIEGWVQGTDGTKLNGVEVTVGDKTVVTGRKPGSDSNNNGYFAIYGLSPVQYTLQASLAGYRTRTTNAVLVAPGTGSGLEVALATEGAQLATLSGVVSSATGGAVIGGALVRAGWGLYTLTAADGSYSLPDVPAGTAQLKVTREAYRPQIIDNVPMPVGEAIYNLSLVDNSVPVGTIRGYVVDIRNRNQGLGGVWVQATGGLAAVTDSNGLYQINNVPLFYNYTVEAIPRTGSGYLGRGFGPVKAGANVDLALTPDSAETGSLRGQVIIAVTGIPVPNVLVRAGFGLLASTDIDGNYSFDNLIPATYHLQAYKSVYEASTGSIEVIEHQQSTADFKMTPSATAGSVSGYVFYGGSRPSYDRFNGPHLNDAVISVGGRHVVTGRQPGATNDNNSNGYYAIYGLAPGSYQISFMKPGYQVILGTVNVSDNGSTRYDFDPPSGANVPIVAITSPAGGTQVQGTVTVQGTVIDDDLASYTLSFAPAGTENWSDITNVAGTPVVGSVLGQWDTSSLQPANYRLRLSARSLSQQVTTKEVTVTVLSSAPVSLASVSPSGVVEGTAVAVTIRGTGLAAGTIARIGGIRLQNVTVDAQGTILTGTLPPLLLAGVYELVLEVPERDVVTVAEAFRVVGEAEVTNLSVDQAQLGPGGQTWVDIRVDKVANMYGMELELSFDPRVVTINNLQTDVQFNMTGDAITGEVFSLEGHRSLDLNDTDGDETYDEAILSLSSSRSFDEYGYAGFDGSAVLARVLFTGVAEGKSLLTLKNVEFRGNTGDEGSDVVLLLPIVTHNGEITVTTQTGIFGRIDLEGVPAVVEDHARFSNMAIDTLIILSGITDDLQEDGTSELSTQVTAQPNGTFDLGDVPAGNYNIVASRRGYLTRLVAEDLRVETGGSLSLGATLLLTGDLAPAPDPDDNTVFGDNMVDLSDLVFLRNRYGWKAAGDSFLTFADLDWDGKVGLVDLVLLVRNYAKAGYEPPPVQG